MTNEPAPKFDLGGGDPGYWAPKIIERMKEARPTCEVCQTCSFDEACDARGKVARIPTSTDAFMRANGWEEDDARIGYTRRCSICQDKPLYPWADKLEPERVAAYILAHYPNKPVPFAVLQDTLDARAYNYPVQTQIEHGQTAADGFFREMPAQSALELLSVPYRTVLLTGITEGRRVDAKLCAKCRTPELRCMCGGGLSLL